MKEHKRAKTIQHTYTHTHRHSPTGKFYCNEIKWTNNHSIKRFPPPYNYLIEKGSREGRQEMQEEQCIKK